MKKSMFVSFVASFCVLLVSSGQEEVQQISGFIVPDYDEKMQLKSKLYGDSANIRPDGKVDINNLRIEFFSDGEVDMRVTAPECMYDRKNKTAESKNVVRIAKDNMVVTGKGFSWNAEDERFSISTNAKVVLKNLSKSMNSEIKE